MNPKRLIEKRIAAALWKLKKYDEGLSMCDEALKKCNKDCYALCMKSTILECQQKHEDALSYSN